MFYRQRYDDGSYDMILFLFSVHDSKVGAYLPPLTARSKGEAVRMFTGACKDEKHEFSKHRGDFVLWQIGAFKDDTGELVASLERIIGGDEL